MARKTKVIPLKKAVYVFWEGESEESYSKYLGRKFTRSAAIHVHREKGTFYTAQAYYRGNTRFQNDVEELDEIWFFFDTEVEIRDKWDEYIGCLDKIITSRKKSNPIRIRLLMTTCCIEYWLLLHYRQTAPAMSTPADKEKRMKELQEYVPNYEKGDNKSISVIAENYTTAVTNGCWVLERLKESGMPERTPDDTVKSDEWLFKGNHTFTTVHEALEMLISLPKL